MRQHAPRKSPIRTTQKGRGVRAGAAGVGARRDVVAPVRGVRAGNATEQVLLDNDFEIEDTLVLTSPEEADAQGASDTGATSLYFKVQADDMSVWGDGVQHPVRFSLHYLDEGTETLTVGYSSNGTTENATKTLVTKTETGDWKWKAVHISNMRLGHSVYAAYDNADFRVYSTAEVYANGARLRETTVKIKVHWKGDYFDADQENQTASFAMGEDMVGAWEIGENYLIYDTGADATSAGLAPEDYPFYAGATYANRPSAPFRVTPAGALVATSATITGSITATAGSIGGWTIGASTLSNGGISLDSSVPKITVGSATGYLTGAGIFMGSAGGTYKFHIGNPSGNYLSWDGTNLAASGQWITGAGMNPSLQTWKTNITFSSASATQVNWSSGTIRLNDGTTYSISSGNTGTVSALTYIYLDTAVSTTVLQTTTTYSTAVGSGKILIAAAQNDSNAIAASVIPFGGQQPIVNGAQIAALSIVAGNIAAGAITATKISVSQLSAISADMGTITAGTVTGATIRTASSGTRILEDTTGLYGYSGSSGVFALPVSSVSWNGKSLVAGDFALGIQDSNGNLPLLMQTNELQLIGLAVGHKSFTTTTTVGGKTNCLDPEGYSFLRYTGSGTVGIKYLKKPTTASAKILYIKNDVQKKMTLSNNVASPPTGYASLSLYGADVVFASYGTCVLLYDSVNQRWSLASKKADTTNTGYQPLSDAGYGADVSVLSLIPTSVVIANGALISAKSGGTLQDDMVVDAASTWTMSLLTPQDGTTQLLANSDVCYITDGTNTTWFTVTFVANDGDVQTYTCTFASGTRPATYPAGTGVVDYGASGQGFLKQTGNSGAPYYAVQTHAGSPWSTVTDRARIGNLNGSFGIASNLYGAAFGDYATGNYFRYDTSGGFVLKAGGNNITLDSTGIKLLSGLAGTNAIQWTYLGDEVGQLIQHRVDLGGSFTNNGIIISANYDYITSGSGISTYGSIDLSAKGSDGTLAYIAMAAGAGNGSISYVANAHAFQGEIDIQGAAPKVVFMDTTASAKDLQIVVDGNKATFQEDGGGAPNLMVLDLVNKRVGIGTATPDNMLHVQGSESVRIKTSGGNGGIYCYYTGASSSGVSPIFGIGVDDGAAMATSDQLGRFMWLANDGTGMQQSGFVGARCTEDWSSTAHGMEFAFYTCANGSTLLVQAMVIKSDQSITVAGGINAVTMNGDVTMANAKNIVLNATTGTKIGTATTQKLGFYNATPIVQPSAYTQTYSTADKTHAAQTATGIAANVPAAAPAGGTGTAAGGWDTAANRNSAITTINGLRTWALEMDGDYEALLVDVTDLKQLVNALIDDLQALGLVA